MVSHRQPPSARTAYLLTGCLLVGVFAAAVASRSESRQEFIVRQQVGDFNVDAPSFNPPDFDGPNVDSPDGPNINGPDINPPSFGWAEGLFLFLLTMAIVGLIAGLILILKRFGPGANYDEVDGRTSALGRSGHTGFIAEGDEGWAAFERFCYGLMQDPDPSRAVRIVMRYAESGFGRLESRMADETPNEWKRRIRSADPELEHHVAPIVTSYNAVRFGGGGASPAERDAAVEALRRLARSACRSAPPDTLSETQDVVS